MYYQDEKLCIRKLCEADIAPIVLEEMAQGWGDNTGKLQMRMAHEASGKCITLCAVYEGRPVGYVFVYPEAKDGAFGGTGLPEIVDFAVAEKFRCKGIGSKLMDAAEKIAARYADTVYLGVGLHSGYGSAQRMYIKRGYIPDGSGVWYGEKVCTPYTPCVNDDGLILYLSKRLR